MINSLFKHSINRLFDRVIVGTPQLVDGKIGGLYSSKRVRVIGEKNKYSYEGYTLCGAVSHIIYYSIDKPFVKYIHCRGKGRKYEDHLFLKHNDIIIDGTWRQMFRSTYGTGNEEYFKILYEKNPPFFVGTLDELKKLESQLIKQHIKDFGTTIQSPMEFYEKAVKY